MIFGISKTTINGILAFLIATFTTVLGFQIPSAMLSPGANHIWLYVTLACNFAVALMRVWVGLLQNDTPPPPPSDPPAPSSGISVKVLPVFLLLALLVPMAGCATASSPTPPLAPGYSNQADQVMGQTLAAAHAFYQQLQQDTVDGKFFPSPTEKTVLNDFAISINIAQTTYLAFHNGQATQASAQAAIDQVSAKQAAVQTTIPGVK